jgi:hypothetical protein
MSGLPHPRAPLEDPSFQARQLTRAWRVAALVACRLLASPHEPAHCRALCQLILTTAWIAQHHQCLTRHLARWGRMLVQLPAPRAPRRGPHLRPRLARTAGRCA